MNSPENPIPPENMISQPLMTPEGFVNPACMNELEAAIKGIPPTYIRLKGDPEWDLVKNNWTFRHEIVASFAYSACQLSPYGMPEGLESVCAYLNECLKTEFKWGTHGLQELSLVQINRALHDILHNKGVKAFDAWNRCKKGDTPEIAFSSRFDGPRDPDRDFIDLDALLHNVCIIMRDFRRAKAETFRRVDAAVASRNLGSDSTKPLSDT